MTRFRILHVITRFIVGGAQENTLLSVLGLRRIPRWDVYLATGPASGPEGSLLDRARAEGIHPIILRHMQREINPFEDIAAYAELGRLVRRIRPHIVHTHSSKAGILGRLAAYHESVPAIVHTIHGPSFHPYERRWRNAIFVLLERWAARRTDALVSVADAMTQQYLAKNVGEPAKYSTIRSGIEVEPFLSASPSKDALRQRQGIPRNAFVFATVSRIAPLKGHEDILSAAATIKAKAPDLHLLFVGDGTLKEEIRRLSCSLGLEEHVTFTGLLPPDGIPEMLRAADAVVHASYREGLPRAVVQGGLAGIPAAAYAVDGTEEAIEEGRDGYLVKAGDRERLADRMLDLYQARDQARAMGLRARERLRKAFDWHNMVQSLDSLYVKVLRTKGYKSRMLDTSFGNG